LGLTGPAGNHGEDVKEVFQLGRKHVAIKITPRPDYFFLWLYALLSLLPPQMETPALLTGPVIAILFLLLQPFLFGEGEKVGGGVQSPFSLFVRLWMRGSGDPIPQQFLQNRSALERQGALIFQLKQCHNCHALGNEGFGGAGIERVHHIRLAVNGSRGFVGSMRASEQMRLRLDIATYSTSASSDFSTWS
jgi:hypothetical protein